MSSVMIVEDDSDTREMYTQALEMSDYRVLPAGSGHQALEILAHEKPDMLILDVSLPDMSGIDFVKRLRADPDLQKLKVLLVSGWEDVSALAKEAGASGYLRKPFDLRTLHKMVHQTLLVS